MRRAPYLSFTPPRSLLISLSHGIVAQLQICHGTRSFLKFKDLSSEHYRSTILDLGNEG